MKSNEITLFVPGRLCLIGEHSDWACKYNKQNNNQEDGYAISTTLDYGIKGIAKKSNNITIDFKKTDIKTIKCNLDEINKIIKEDNFWKYIFSAVRYMIKKYNVSGINIEILSSTLPMKKGLASSAAIILFIVKAYNILYNLKLSSKEEMNIAYESEISIGSKCGKLDQFSIFPKGIKLMHFSDKLKNGVETKNIKVKEDIYMVVADLKGSKNTIKILNDLNACYPNYINQKQKNVHTFLGKENKKKVYKAVKLIEEGKIKEFGELLTEYQNKFDKALMPISDELKSPILHKTLNDITVKELTYGGKGCGSGGDGAIQFVAKDALSSKKLITYLNNKLHMDARSVVIKKNIISKAIIPIGGYGTRMYPITKIIGKEFLPLKDKDGIIKPAILILLKEIIESGIDQIGLIMPREYQKNYQKLFKKNSAYSYNKEFENELKNIYNRITFIDDSKHKGLGNAIKLAKKFVGDENFIVLLGDQIYESYSKKRCIEQVLETYYKYNIPIIPVSKCDKLDVTKYGIVYGNKSTQEDVFKITEFKEKPSIKYAEEKLEVNNDFYCIFGCYILKNDYYKYLRDSNDDFNIALEKYITQNDSYAFIPNGKFYDIGNQESYYETFLKYSNKK